MGAGESTAPGNICPEDPELSEGRGGLMGVLVSAESLWECCAKRAAVAVAGG